jgi:transitional endoplasmic reticulum ATPase
MIAKAIANEVGAVFFDVRCSQIVQKYFGVAERNVKNLFETARKHEVAIIFFDEFESLASKRGSGSTVMDRIVPELLSQIDGFTSSYNTLMLIAATNRPWAIDSAFLRPGRFSELLPVPLPDVEARLHIIKKAYNGIPHEKDVDIEKWDARLMELAEQTEGFNGADVVEFCARSTDPAADRCIEEYGDALKGLSRDDLISKGLVELRMEDIEATLEHVKSSVQQKDLDELEKFISQFQKV